MRVQMKERDKNGNCGACPSGREIENTKIYGDRTGEIAEMVRRMGDNFPNETIRQLCPHKDSCPKLRTHSDPVQESLENAMKGFWENSHFTKVRVQEMNCQADRYLVEEKD